jgi:alpha-galactosidase
MGQTVHLKSDGVSLIIDTSAATPVIVHWGRAVTDSDVDVLAITEPSPHCDFDAPELIGIWRENARGFIGEPALRGSRVARDWSHKFELRNTSVDGNVATFTSVDVEAELEVSARFELTAQGVLKVSQKVTNLGFTEFNVEALSAYLPIPDYTTDVLDFHGRWMRERQPQRQPIHVGQWVREGREGRTGHDFTLIQLALTSGTTFEAGEAWGVSLAWSGNNRHLVERTAIGRTFMAANELLLPGEVVLASGETYEAPTVVATYSSAGIDGVSDRLHRMVRARANHPTNIRPRPITLNVWEAVYFDHDYAKLAALAEAASKIGVERFVLDDGWFGSRRDDHAGLGDWVVSADVWPEGLGKLIDKVKAEGMEFGLWFEGEMINADSDLYRAHPEWILHSGGRVPPEFRTQQVLDLAHPGAYAHVFEQVDAILSEYDIAYIKWDHNRVLTEASHLGQAAVRKQVQAVYRMFDELKAAHPGLEIESCASGGARIDLGMIEHADRFWTSDNNDALERQSINRYTSIVIPPELLGTHIGPTKAHSTGRTHTHTFRAVTALWGHAGLEWDLTEASDDEMALLRGWVDYYKAKRGLLHTGRTVRGDQSEANSQTHGVVAQDASEAVFMYAALRPSDYSRPANIRLPGLDADATYEVKLVEPAGAATVMQLLPPKWYSGVRMSGALLASMGLRAPVLRPEQAILIEAKRV